MVPIPFGEELFAWLWRTSWQVGALVLVVLLVQVLLGRWLSPRGRYALWLLVVLRLCVPAVSSVPGGIFAWDRVTVAEEAARSSEAETRTDEPRANPSFRVVSRTAGRDAKPKQPRPEAERAAASESIPREERAAPTGSTRLVENLAAAPTPSAAETDSPAAAGHLVGWRDAAVGLWALVALGAFLRYGFLEWAFARRIARAPRLEQAALVASVEECRRIVGVRRPVQLVATEAVASPAVAGVFRPKVLLPERVLRSFDDAELRHLFLHELSHVRRGDIALNALLAGLSCLFWFHPVVHFAIGRLRASQESVRDWDAVNASQTAAPTHYARTLLKLSERCPRERQVSPAVGILTSSRHLKRRILMIANFRKPRPLARVIGVLAFVSIGWASLTNAAPTPAPPSGGPNDAKAPDSVLQTIDVVRKVSPPAWHDALQKRLQEPVSFAVSDANLADCVTFLREETGINFVLPREVRRDWSNSAITVEVRDTPLDRALRLLLRTLSEGELGYCLARNAVFVGYDHELPRSFDLRFYKVRHLLNTDDEDDEHRRSDHLIDLVREMSGTTDSWDASNAPWINYWNGLLVVNQTDEMHGRVHEFLNLLANRGARKELPDPEWKRNLHAALAETTDGRVLGRRAGRRREVPAVRTRSAGLRRRRLEGKRRSSSSSRASLSARSSSGCPTCTASTSRPKTAGCSSESASTQRSRCTRSVT